MTLELQPTTIFSTERRSFSQAKTAAFAPKSLDYDLVIVGGGIVGLTLACALKDSGLRIAVVEATVESAAIARGQAYHINLLSSRIFRGMGVWEQMRPAVNPIEEIHLSDANDPRRVQFLRRELQSDDAQLEALGYVAEHRVVIDVLQASLQGSADVERLCPVEVVKTDFQADGVELTLKRADQSYQVRSQLVVAADGARSPLRQRMGIHAYGWHYQQSCIVAFIQPQQPHQNIAYERFQADGPFAILPLPNNLCRIVWTVPKAEAEAILALDDEQFLAKLKDRYGDQMGELSLVGQRYLFPVQLMHSSRYSLPRLALVGDAAHCCHPVGGQGVNLGIRDTAALAQILIAAHRNGQDLGDLTVLRNYDRWRSLENLAILGFTDLLNRLFSNTVLPLVIMRRLGLRLMQQIPFIKILALRLMVGLLGRAPELAKR